MGLENLLCSAAFQASCSLGCILSQAQSQFLFVPTSIPPYSCLFFYLLISMCIRFYFYSFLSIVISTPILMYSYSSLSAFTSMLVLYFIGEMEDVVLVLCPTISLFLCLPTREDILLAFLVTIVSIHLTLALAQKLYRILYYNYII